MPAKKKLEKIELPVIPQDCGFKIFRPPAGYVYVLDLTKSKN
jgi:hypothetical protein